MLVYGVGFISLLLACCALMLDIGTFEITKFRMQNAADAAAIGGVFASEDGDTALNGATQGAQLNGFTAGVNNVTIAVTNPPLTGGYTGSAYSVQVVITQKVTPVFAPLSFNLSAQATAFATPTPCVYLLSTISPLTSISSTNESIQTSCPFYIGRSYSLDATSSSTGGLYFVAGAPGNSTGSVSPGSRFGAPTMADPLSYVAAPPIGSCTYTNYSVTAAATLQPGTYCGGLTILTSAAVKLNPGMYVILGSLNINGPNLTGAGVTFYLTQNAYYPYGASVITNVNATLSAPTTGTWQGLLYFSDRSLPGDKANLSLSNWNPNTTMSGIFYLAGQGLYCSNIPLKGTAYFGLVADFLNIHNTGFVSSANYSSLANGNPFHPIGGGGGIVE